MSELKAFNCVDSDLQEFCEPRLVYLKSEADKVIAHQKRKRCLAMAEACMHKRWRTDEGFDYARSNRHMKKWLEIAEQFKEAK